MSLETKTLSHCPLCSLDFEGEECRSSCPTSAGCTMVRCPSCGYEFVEKSAVADLVRSLFARVAARRGEKPDREGSRSSHPAAGSHAPTTND